MPLAAQPAKLITDQNFGPKWLLNEQTSSNLVTDRCKHLGDH